MVQLVLEFFYNKTKKDLNLESTQQLSKNQKICVHWFSFTALPTALILIPKVKRTLHKIGSLIAETNSKIECTNKRSSKREGWL